ncbi:MAG: DNA adenine methylase, partial [Candidatus Saccharimonadales bacterium]
MSSDLRRPVLRYHGGKWRLAPWIMTFFPSHRMYVEPFGGGGSVLMRKPRSYAEVYNDLDGEVVNVFRVLRDPLCSAMLEEQLRLTPFARDEFEDAYESTSNPVEQARRTIIKAFMGFGSASIHNTTGFRTLATTRPPTGFRSNSNRSGTTPAHDWANYPEQIANFCDRLAGIVIENRDARALISQHDNPEALFYVDPPYPFGTRSDHGKDYT